MTLDYAYDSDPNSLYARRRALRDRQAEERATSGTVYVVVPPAVLADTSQTAAERQLQVPGEGAPLRIVLGEDCIGAQAGPWWFHGGNLYVRCIWAGGGESEGVQAIFIDGKPMPSDVLATHYTGTATQGIDPWLAAAGAAQSPPIEYTDTLHGIAYSVLMFPPWRLTSAPQAVARFRGLKLYDPRTETTVWSDNAGLAFRAFLSAPWGENKPITGGDVDVANRCDELCGTAPDQEKRNRIGITLSARQPASAWRETLRTYAECFVVPDGDGYLLIPDAPASSEYTYSHAAGNLLELGNIKRAGTSDLPTVVTGWYTDRSVEPWRDIAIAPIKRPGVDTGALPWRPQEIRINGIFSAGQITRVCTTRLNKLWLCDLSGDIHTLDDGMQVRPGTVVTLTDPRGITNKTVRVFGCSGINGQYIQTFIEHDNAAYSDVVVEDPTTPDTDLPSPNEPPAVTGVTMTEEVFQLENGTYASRWHITWAAETYPYLAHFRAELWDGSALIHNTAAPESEWTTPQIQEGVNYTAKVVAVSVNGRNGTWGTQSALAQGKLLIPGDVSGVTAFEAGGWVFLSWNEASDLDIWRYEVKYGPVGGTWDTATMVDHVDALRLSTNRIPVGTWVCYVKAEDSVRQYSVNAATCTVTVTSDSNSFLVDSYDQTSPTLTNILSYTLAPTDTNIYYITDDLVTWNAKFSNAMNTYTNPLATYHDSVTSTWLGEAEDFGQLLGGDWSGDATVVDVSGSHISYLGHSVDGSAWTYLTGLSHKINARFARLKHEALTTSTLKVTVPNQKIRLNAIPREEVASAAVTSSASNAKTIFLANDYVSTKRIGITILGAVAATHVEDNIGRNAPNSADKSAGLSVSGNTVTHPTSAGWYGIRCRHPLPASGKWYFAVKIDNGGAANYFMVGLATRSVTLTNTYAASGAIQYSGSDANVYKDGLNTGDPAAYTTGDVIGVAYDRSTGQVTFYKNGTSQGTFTWGSGDIFPMLSTYSAGGSDSATFQFVSSDFIYAPPSGYLPLPYAFDEHIFDIAGARIARDFLWSFQGV